MKVRAIAITKSLVDPLESGQFREMTAEELIIYEARVSNPENQGNIETSPKLLKFLIDHQHWSPFDMVNLTVEVETSKMVAIQILRHWSIHPQEFSQRYAEVTNIEPIELRKKAGSNRQGSDGEPFDPEMSIEYGDPTIMYYNKDGTPMRASGRVSMYINEGKKLYKQLLEYGIAPECARQILPMASTTTMYLNGTVRSWIHYLQQRTSEHAQKEHKLVALEIEKIFKQYFPNVAEALNI